MRMTPVEPDNPKLTTIDVCVRREIMEPGQWVAEPKVDGWRRPLYLMDGKWTSYAKYSEGEQAKTSPPDTLMQELASLNLPDGTALDAEWMGRRSATASAGRNWFVILDLIFFGGQWQGDIPYMERKKSMETLLNLHMAKHWTTSQKIKSNILIIPYKTKEFRELYEEQKKNPLTEGIVMKRVDSRLKGGGDNSSWSKIRYR